MCQAGMLIYIMKHLFFKTLNIYCMSADTQLE